MHEVLVNRLGGLSLPRKSVVRLTDRPDMTLDVYRGRKTTMQQQQQQKHENKIKFSIVAKLLTGFKNRFYSISFATLNDGQKRKETTSALKSISVFLEFSAR